MNSRLKALALICAATVLVGCGAVQVRTSSDAGGPIGVHVAETAGPTPTPTETGPVLQEGYAMTAMHFEGKCPVPIRVALPSGFTLASESEEHMSFIAGDTALDRPLIAGSCRAALFDDTAIDYINSRQSYSFADEGTEVLTERKGQFGNGYFWSYQVDMPPSEIMAGTEQTTMYGAEVAYSVQGRLYQIWIYASTPSDDSAGKTTLSDALSYVELDGQLVTMPAWVE